MGRFLLIIGGLIMTYIGFTNLQKNADKPYTDELARLSGEAEKADIQRKMQIDDAIVNRRLLKGMTPDQVLRSWGAPEARKSSMIDETRSEIWIYGETAIGFTDFGTGEGLRLSNLPPARSQ